MQVGVKKKRAYVRKSHEEFQQLFKTVSNGEYLLKSQYQGRTTPIQIKHLLCGHEYEILPHGFMNGARCKACYDKRRRKDPLLFEQRFNEQVGKEFSLLEPYETGRTPLKIQHLVCGNAFEKLPHPFLANPRCPHCHPRRKTTTGVVQHQFAIRTYYQQEFEKELAYSSQSQIQLIGNYSTRKTKAQFYHCKCGHYFEDTPHSIIHRLKCTTCFPKKRQSKSES